MVIAPRVLLVESIGADRDFMLAELQRSFPSVEVRCADSRKDLTVLLDNFAPMVVVSAVRLPEFTALEALATVHTKFPGLPIIVVTRDLAPEAVAECLRCGASDFLDRQYLWRIGPKVRVALDLRHLAHSKRRLEHDLARVYELMPDLFCVLDCDGVVIEVNPAWNVLLGRTRETLLGCPLVSLLPADDRESRRRFDESFTRREGVTDVECCLSGRSASRTGCCGAPP
jgi:PAS domain-containing protein